MYQYAIYLSEFSSYVIEVNRYGINIHTFMFYRVMLYYISIISNGRSILKSQT